MFDSYAFDFERNYDKLIKKFRYMPLFSVYFHFLRCRRSCERKLGYCKVCSGVRENTFYEYNAFLNLIVDSTTGDYLNISSSEQIDLDVFLNKPAYFPYCHCESIGKSSDFEFSFARDLFAAFCSVLVRMYLNHTTEYFSDLMSQVSLTYEKKIIQKMFSFALQLLHKFFDINCFFMSFLICLIGLMQVNVMLYVLVSQNLAHIVGQNIP